jgi:hypothetical protein
LRLADFRRDPCLARKRGFCARYFASATIVFTEAVTPPPTSTSTI